MNGDAALIAIAAIGFAATAGIGAFVATRPRTRIDVEALMLRGHGTPLAVVFTRSGYWPALSAICLVQLGLALALHTGTTFVLVLSATQLLTQVLAERIKRVVRRIRPDDWLFHQELGFSFPSGHATTAIVFFGGLELFVWTLPLPDPLRALASAVIAVWIAGIPWSRLVLGAHYATDVLAGACFGGGSLALMALVLHRLPAVPIFG